MTGGKHFVSLLIGALLPVAAGAAFEADQGAVRRSEERYFAGGSTQTLQDFALQLEAIYQASMRPRIEAAKLKKLDDRELAALFDTMQTVAFYSESPAVVRDMATVFPEIALRRLDAPELLRNFNDVCLLTHMDESCALAKKYPQAHLLVAPPIRRSASQARTERALDVADDVTGMTVESISWKKGSRIIMLFSPSCNPSNMRGSQSLGPRLT